MKASSPLVLVAVLVAVVAALFVPAQALAVDRTFAGSAQIDYHFIPDRASREGQATQAFGGFTLEAALKLSVDVSDHLSANVKVCVGCHGFETDMAYLDTLERGYRVKLSGETYSFSDEGPTGHHVALSGHVGVVGTF